MRSSNFIIVFITLLTSFVALVLSLLFTGLKDIHDENQAIFQKKFVLLSIQEKLGESAVMDMSNQDVAKLFNDNIEQVVVNSKGEILDKAAVESKGYPGGMAENINLSKEKKKAEAERLLPVYIYKGEKDHPIYILSLKGNGLWDEVSGNVALDSDLNTVVGVSFDHVSETPGMGAEIKDNPNFRLKFAGKKIFDESGNYRSITLMKGGATDLVHEVDGITAATLTGAGVTRMLQNGIKSYEAYIKSIQQ